MGKKEFREKRAKRLAKKTKNQKVPQGVVADNQEPVNQGEQSDNMALVPYVSSTQFLTQFGPKVEKTADILVMPVMTLGRSAALQLEMANKIDIIDILTRIEAERIRQQNLALVVYNPISFAPQPRVDLPVDSARAPIDGSIVDGGDVKDKKYVSVMNLVAASMCLFVNLARNTLFSTSNIYGSYGAATLFAGVSQVIGAAAMQFIIGQSIVQNYKDCDSIAAIENIAVAGLIAYTTTNLLAGCSPEVVIAANVGATMLGALKESIQTPFVAKMV